MGFLQPDVRYRSGDGEARLNYMAAFRSLDALDVGGKRVLVRLDLNVPMQDGQVSDSTRIDRALPTVKDLVAAGARVVLLSHFGRPKGKRVPELSLQPVATALATTMGGQNIAFADDCIGEAAAVCVNGLQNGEIALLENVRFHSGEEANDPDFARALAANGDFYVNDAFSCAHRAHASTEALAHLLPAAAGRNMAAELVALQQALSTPTRPLAALVGGAKVSSKLEVLSHLIDKVDALIIGGGMANTFLYAQGLEVGTSLCENDLADTAQQIMAKAAAQNCEILLPVDVVVAKEFSAHADSAAIDVRNVPENMMILDIGPRSRRQLSERLKDIKTLVWNGPLGAFEITPFDAGTNAVAQAAAALSKTGALVTVAGGGDTVAALRHASAADDFNYISTAGGAFLEWLEGKDLPGVVALQAG